jgi:hypothetical protein
MHLKRGHLSDYFEGVGVKRLTPVDAEPTRSNQHEVGTTRAMEEFLGREKKQFRVKYIWLGTEEDSLVAEGSATMYDTREGNEDRNAEWRLYYRSNPVTEAMSPGDTLFLAKERSGALYFVVTTAGSTNEKQLLWLFDLQPKGKSFVSRSISDDDPGLDFAARFILDELGIEFDEPDSDKLDSIIDRFGMVFPKTAEFSSLARQALSEIDPSDNPDYALMAWLDQEEAMFRRLERRIVAERLSQGFQVDNAIDVDGFLSFSLSVQNRRKSRMGHSLENHLEAVFRAYGLVYARGAVTEAGNKPDFLFPSAAFYQLVEAGHPALAMLAAKSTCKDRWRQVLPEANKIPHKHLITLEPGISISQTNQMQASKVTLIVPSSIQVSYTEEQRGWLWNVADFIGFVQAKSALE